VKSVTNPMPSSGGADPARPDQVRALAPSTIRSFGRVVGVSDYAAMALGYPGVAKANAAWVTTGPSATTPAPAPQPHILLTLATTAQVPLAQQPAFTRGFRVFLDQRRDPNVPLRLGDYTPVYIEVAATIDVEDRSPRLATLARVQAALRPGLNPDGTPGFFAFDRLRFGQGLDDADPNAVRDAITVAPTELITIGNDPNDSSKGSLTVVLGGGGFVDS
jgi:hypothetical protein